MFAIHLLRDHKRSVLLEIQPKANLFYELWLSFWVFHLSVHLSFKSWSLCCCCLLMYCGATNSTPIGTLKHLYYYYLFWKFMEELLVRENKLIAKIELSGDSSCTFHFSLSSFLLYHVDFLAMLWFATQLRYSWDELKI